MGGKEAKETEENPQNCTEKSEHSKAHVWRVLGYLTAFRGAFSCLTPTIQSAFLLNAVEMHSCLPPRAHPRTRASTGLERLHRLVGVSTK